KAAIHHEGESANPDLIRREVSDQEVDRLRGLLSSRLPFAAGRLQSAVVCMYTNTPDSHFILGHHPVFPQVVIASPCSGHGFKFSAAIGEIAAALLEDRPSGFDLSLFALARFAQANGLPAQQSNARKP